jgi:hypothetical protein
VKDIEISSEQARWNTSIMVGGAFAALGTTIFAPEITHAGRALGLGLSVAAVALASYWFKQI